MNSAFSWTPHLLWSGASRPFILLYKSMTNYKELLKSVSKCSLKGCGEFMSRALTNELNPPWCYLQLRTFVRCHRVAVAVTDAASPTCINAAHASENYRIITMKVASGRLLPIQINRFCTTQSMYLYHAGTLSKALQTMFKRKRKNRPN